jgi:hypothetical protein
MLPGLRHRLDEETSARQVPTWSPEPLFPGSALAWVGTSLAAATDGASAFAVAREGALSDWLFPTTDAVESAFPLLQGRAARKWGATDGWIRQKQGAAPPGRPPSQATSDRPAGPVADSSPPYVAIAGIGAV